MKYQFECPKCGCTDIEEFRSRVNIRTRVDVNPDGSMSYSNPENEDTINTVTSYNCEECGDVISDNGKDISSIEELEEWLSAHYSIHQIIVEVRGGMIVATHCSTEADVDILDWDNMKCELEDCNNDEEADEIKSRYESLARRTYDMHSY